MKRFISVILVFVLILTFVSACSKTEDKKEVSKEEKKEEAKKHEPKKKEDKDIYNVLFNEVKEAKFSVDSFKMKSTFVTKVNAKESKQTFEADIIFDERQVARAHAISKGSTSSIVKNNFIETVMTTKNDKKYTYTRTQKDGKWNSQKSAWFRINPDYFKIINTILSNKDSFDIKEEGDEYKLVFNQSKDESVSLFNLFQGEFMLSVSGVTPDQLKSSLELTFDKETAFLKTLLLEFSYKDDRVFLSIRSNINYSNFNSIKAEEIDKHLKK